MSPNPPQPITVVTSVVPADTGGGSLIRIAATVRALAAHRRVQVVLVTGRDRATAHDELAALSARGIECLTVAEADLSMAGRWRRSGAALLSMVAPTLANRLLPPFGFAAIDEPDGELWFFKTTLLTGRRIPTHGRVIIDLDDIDERTQLAPRTPRQTLEYLRIVARRRRALRVAQVSLVCSDLDRKRLGQHPRVDVLPNTYLVSTTRALNDNSATALDVAMVGRMGYYPNIEGAEWFAVNCWPLVRSQVPEATCRFVGADSNRLAKHEGNGIELVAGISHPSELLHGVAVVIVPILRGSGTRVKILEAMAHGVPVVSTTAGAEGLAVTDGVDIVIRDTPESFAAGVVELLTQPTTARDIGRQSAALFNAEYRFEHFQRHVDRILDGHPAVHPRHARVQ